MYVKEQFPIFEIFYALNMLYTIHRVYFPWLKFRVFTHFLIFADLIFTEAHLEKMKKIIINDGALWGKQTVKHI